MDGDLPFQALKAAEIDDAEMKPKLHDSQEPALNPESKEIQLQLFSEEFVQRESFDISKFYSGPVIEQIAEFLERFLDRGRERTEQEFQSDLE